MFFLLVALCVAALCLSAGGGCARREVANPMKPKLLHARVDVSRPVLPGTVGIGGSPATLWVNDSGQVFIGTGTVSVIVTFDVDPDPRWQLDNVAVEGTDSFEVTCSDKRLVCYFQGGPPGETLTISLGSVRRAGTDEDTFVLTLVRVAETAAALEVERGGRWWTVSTGDVLGDGPLRLRLSFTREVNRPSVDRVLTEVSRDISWPDDRTALFTIDGPPQCIEVVLWEATDSLGLKLVCPAWRFYTGAPPRLRVIEPGTTFQAALCEVPADISAAAASPGGETLLITYYQARSFNSATSLVRAADGTLRALPDGFRYYTGWVDAHTLLRFSQSAYELISTAGSVLRQGSLPAGLDLLSLSPDGTRLAGYLRREPEERPASGWFDTMDLVVLDLQARQSVTFEGFIHFFNDVGVSFGEGPGRPFWSPDGRMVAAIGNLRDGSGSVLRVLDLLTNRVEIEVALPGLTGPTTGSWSPDGTFWTAGELLLSARPPYDTYPVRLEGAGIPLWSPDGRWLARNAFPDGWGGLILYRLDPVLGLVEQRSLGTAFPCGWDAQGRFYYVTWPASYDRYVPSLGYTGTE